MVLITIVNGVYKSFITRGAPPCGDLLWVIEHWWFFGWFLVYKMWFHKLILFCWNSNLAKLIQKKCVFFAAREVKTMGPWMISWQISDDFLAVLAEVTWRIILVGTMLSQWEFQDPKTEVPTIYKAYFSGLCKGIYPQNMAKNMVLTYLHFRILEFPLS